MGCSPPLARFLYEKWKIAPPRLLRRALIHFWQAPFSRNVNKVGIQNEGKKHRGLAAGGVNMILVHHSNEG